MVTPPGYAPVPQQAYGYVPLRPSAPQNGYAMASANGPALAGGYSLGPGDKIRVSVFGEDDLSGEYQIDSSGMVRLPLIGTVRAAGFSTAALENAIAGALAQGYLKNPRVNVEVSTYRPFYIIGAVNKPGEYPYVANMSALNAVAFGGGFTDQARQSTIFVRHEGSTTEEEVPASQITMIYPGDVVRVKTTVFWDAMNVFSPIAGPAVLAAAALH
jgi:polysaccharide export outer membrane protein